MGEKSPICCVGLQAVLFVVFLKSELVYFIGLVASTFFLFLFSITLLFCLKSRPALSKMLKGSSTLKALDVRLRLMRPLLETRSAGKCKLHNLKPMASLEPLWCSKIERSFYYHCSGCGRQQQQQHQQRSFSNSIHRSYITFNDFRTKNRWYSKKELVG